MQKQKTIAKWLAVILLMTIAVASYVVLSALVSSDQGKSNNVAGANDGDKPDVPSQIVEPKPVYSTLPRKSESVLGASVAHVGGEGEETVLDAFYFAGKTALVFRTESTQYDVKESGIYIAIFDENTLEKTIKIADENDRFLTYCMTRNGVAIFLCDADSTIVRILNENFEIVCENSTEIYDEIEATYTGRNIEAFCSQSGRIRRVVFEDSLRISTDTFVMQTERATFTQIIKFGDKTLLFMQDKEIALGAIFCENTGFTKRFSLNKHRFLQVMPIVKSNEQSFVALFATSNDLSVYSFSSSLEILAKYTVENETFGALLRCESGLNLVCKTKCIRLCSHLDFISEKPVSTIADSSTNSYPQQSATTQNGTQKFTSGTLEKSNFNLEKMKDMTCVLQEDNLFVARFDDVDVLVSYEDGKLAKKLTVKYSGNALVSSVKTKDGKTMISMFLDCDSSTDLTYMCFGKTDAFFISVLTTSL